MPAAGGAAPGSPRLLRPFLSEFHSPSDSHLLNLSVTTEPRAVTVQEEHGLPPLTPMPVLPGAQGHWPTWGPGLTLQSHPESSGPGGGLAEPLGLVVTSHAGDRHHCDLARGPLPIPGYVLRMPTAGPAPSLCPHQHSQQALPRATLPFTNSQSAGEGIPKT